MPSEEKAEGLVLRRIDYKDRQKIITVFTPDRGLISLIVKGITRNKSHLLTLTTPLTKAEYHFSVGKSDLYTFRDGTPLATHHDLRQNLSHIEAASALLRALLASQLPGKPAPALYALTLAYLKHLPNFNAPQTLTTSYLLKLLLHEGHISPSAPDPLFTRAEWTALLPLLTLRTFAPLQQQPLDLSLYAKVETLFSSKIMQ